MPFSVNRSHGRFRIDKIGLGVFILALGVRLLHVLAIRESPFFNQLLVDSVDFDARAAALLHGGWPEEGAFYQAPLYPLFLSAIYGLFGHDLLVVRIAQALLGAGSAAFVYLVGRRCASAASGVAAAVMYSLYAMAIHFDSEILRPSLVVFLELLSLHLLLSARGRAAPRWGFAGLVLGLASIARPTMLLFAPPALLWILLRGVPAAGEADDSRGRGVGSNASRRGGAGRTRSRRGRWGAPDRRKEGARPYFWASGRRLRAAALAAIFAACALVPVVAVTSVNYLKSGSFVLISYNGGINFYVGNNPNYDKTVGIRPGVRWDLLTAEPPVDRRADPAGWSRYYYEKVEDFALSDPAGFLGLIVKKFVLFWNGHEIERNTSFANVARYSPIIAHPLVSFRWIAPLAFAGMLLALRRRAALGLPALLLMSQIAVTVAFFVCARYRMTSVPVLCLFAGYAAVEIAGETRRQAAAAVPYVGVALLAALAVNLDAYGISKRRYSRPEYELGMVLRREGRTDEAVLRLEAAAQADPDDPDPEFQLGVLMAGRGSFAEAAEHFRAASKIEPRYAKSWFNLGLSLSRAGQAGSAVGAYERALAAEPSYWEAAVGLGDALVAGRRFDEAAGAFRRSLGLARNRREEAVSTISLGRARSLAGDYDAGLKEFDKALVLSPASMDAMLAKARVLLVLDRRDEAARVVSEAARVDSSDTRVKDMLRRLGLDE